ncbi:hypothetical protein LINPERPRIM_LOCUS35862 [Linum perenne]
MVTKTIVMSMLMLVLVLTTMVQVGADPKCTGNLASGAYNDKVVTLVSKLQQKAAHKQNFKASIKMGAVKGNAGCTPKDENKNDRTKASDDCLTCLGAAEVDLAKCKTLSGSSDGITSSGLDGACQMSFGPAK